MKIIWGKKCDLNGNKCKEEFTEDRRNLSNHEECRVHTTFENGRIYILLNVLYDVTKWAPGELPGWKGLGSTVEALD